jgi:hypothetical protein
MILRVTLLRTYISVEGIASIVRMTRIGELRTTLAVTSNRSSLRRNTMHSRPDSCQLDDGGDIFLRNVGSYKIYTV